MLLVRDSYVLVSLSLVFEMAFLKPCHLLDKLPLLLIVSNSRANNSVSRSIVSFPHDNLCY